jgi:hypothetical protein
MERNQIPTKQMAIGADVHAAAKRAALDCQETLRQFVERILKKELTPKYLKRRVA